MQTKVDISKQRRYSRADRLFLYVLIGLLIFSFALSGLHDTLHLVLLVGIPTALIPAILIFTLPGRLITRLVVAVALMVFCALNIQQGMGKIELHFGIFSLLAFLLCYQDWRVIIAAAATAAIHHLSFNYLQAFNYPFICFEQAGFDRVLIHAGYVVVEAGVLTYLAIAMNRESSKITAANGQLEQTFRTMQQAVESVSGGVREITQASSEIAQGNSALAARTEEQAESLTNTSNTMETFTHAVIQNADHALQANQLVLSASEVASAGGNVVNQVVDTMGRINVSSQKIVDIISVIDGMAFQTNLLALNAAVEAARAGEQGRGFAVVASEVRNLAQRSATAAREIKQLIDDSVSNVKAGSQLVAQAGKNMAEIVASVKQVADIMGEINAASTEQRSGIDRINAAIAAMESMTLKNSQLVTQVSAASENMHHNILRVSDAVEALGQVSLGNQTIQQQLIAQ
jgi:methyl-accepting chemotaxis protein